ncbi:nitrous oxide reductase accessory protein NosL [Halostella salina]|uniref:nitrous oxide reductase accessory protein NosL n=1 Tax=Halostella salina TaxID=1547897 RepID=UPI000EF845F8|nr:nitrous oxide reductase accessory protein NosL [Halostella salina]
MTTHDYCDDGTNGRTDSGNDGPTRRRLIGIAGTAAAVGIAGCLGGSDDNAAAPAAVDVPANAECDVCGMVITRHPGPTTEVFYADEQPNGHDNPARFDSTWEAFQFDFEREDWTREAFYVTDYSTVDYEVRTDGGQQLISTHTTADAFVDATEVTFVVASEVVGAMGRDLIAFSDRADAEAFRSDHGGELAAFDDVTPAMIAELGM